MYSSREELRQQFPVPRSELSEPSVSGRSGLGMGDRRMRT